MRLISRFAALPAGASAGGSSFAAVLRRSSPVPAAFPLLLTLISAIAIPIPISAAAPLTNDTIPVGVSLSPTDSYASCWLSPPNGAFCFGFFAATSSGSYSAGTTFALQPPPPSPTPAWTAAAATVGPGGALRLRSDGDLALEDVSGATVWSSGTAGTGVAAARLTDEGNLVLVTANGSVVWQSFDHPADTLVQNQRLMPGNSLRAGEYSAEMRPSGNLTLLHTDRASGSEFVYWSSDTASGSDSRRSAALINATLTIFDTNSSASLRKWFSSDYTIAAQTVVRRLTLADDGNLRIYSWIVGESSDWYVGWSAVADQCLVYGFCGPNGICSYDGGGDAASRQPSCLCADVAGYLPVDATSDTRSGCRSSLPAAGTSCAMVEMNNTLLFINPAGNSYRYGDDQCGEKCLASATCVAASALDDGSGSCNWVSVAQSYSGYSDPSVPSITFFKFCGSPLPPPPPPSSLKVGDGAPTKANSYVIALVVALICTTVIATLQCAAFLWIWRAWRGGAGGGFRQLAAAAAPAPMQLSYREVRAATKGFSEKLGEGGFGAVYKGRLKWVDEGGGVAEVAVKRLEGLSEQGEKQFRTEVSVIGSTHHMNLVRLFGFCADGKNRLLVYEYMSNGSLDRYLFPVPESGGDGGSAASAAGHPPSVPPPPILEWSARFEILVGAARGITYLHQECRNCIIHCDIKPANILLDDHFAAKVADFGLAKLAAGGAGALRRDSVAALRGTRGYLAPEWRSNLPITVKSDVFSYGVVVLETISGRRCFGAAPERRPMSFCEWAYEQYFNRKQTEGVVDGRMKFERVDMEELDRALKVAFWCLQVQPSARPSMSKVIQMLEGTASKEVGEIPPPMLVAEEVGPAGESGGAAATATTITSMSSSSAATSFA